MQNCSQYQGDGMIRVIHSKFLCIFCQQNLMVVSAQIRCSCVAGSVDHGETILGFSCALRTCPGSCPVLGAASFTQLSPLAAVWRDWLLFLVVSAHWKPSMWFSVARAEEEEGAGSRCGLGV